MDYQFISVCLTISFVNLRLKSHKFWRIVVSIRCFTYVTESPVVMIAVSLGPSVGCRNMVQICAVMLISHSSVHPVSTIPVLVFHSKAITLINICSFFFSITYTNPGSILITGCVSKNILVNLRDMAVIDYCCKSCMSISRRFMFDNWNFIVTFRYWARMKRFSASRGSYIFPPLMLHCVIALI